MKNTPSLGSSLGGGFNFKVTTFALLLVCFVLSACTQPTGDISPSDARGQSAYIGQDVAVETARATLSSKGVIYNPEKDLIVVKEKLLEGEPVYLVGYWVRSNLPEYDNLHIYDEGALSIAPGAKGPPFVPGGERNVYISKKTGQVIKVEFTR